MTDKPWDKQLSDFLKRAGDEFKRTGEEVRKEAQRLLGEMRDPETQAKMRESLSNFGTWAKRTAEDAATMVEGAVRKAEDAFNKASGRVRSEVAGPAKPRAAATRARKTTRKATASRRAGAKKPTSRKRR